MESKSKPETSRDFHYWQPAPTCRWRLLPWLANQQQQQQQQQQEVYFQKNPNNPAMSPHAARKTGTRHTVKTVEWGGGGEGGREGGREGGGRIHFY